MRQHGDPYRDYSGEWKYWRLQHGLTQTQLAVALGCSLRTIINIENSHHPPSLSSRERMAELQKRYREAEA